MDFIIEQIIAQHNFKPNHIEQVLKLLQEGASIPFIARYRKEMTGSMDELDIAKIQKEFARLTELEKRRKYILDQVKESGNLTPEWENAVKKAVLLSELEDLYLPFKPRKRSKAQAAIEGGLEPLARKIFQSDLPKPEQEAAKYINAQFPTVEAVKEGVLEIVALWISEDQNIRKYLRDVFMKHGIFSSNKKRGKREGEEVYTDYFDYTQVWHRMPSHRLLACLRGEREAFLNVKISIDSERTIPYLQRRFSRSTRIWTDEACEKAYDKILQPHFEKECLELAKEKADLEAIAVFGSNLKQLLLAPPLGNKRIMAIDPGFRTGCKVVCLNEQGDLLHNETIYPHPPQKETAQAMKKIRSLAEAYKIEAIAIGNGTAGRETEDFISRIVFPEKSDLQVFVVSEAGASIYSASAIAREEFPQYDITVRGSVSIGRRLMDPLAELVKLDPKSIGVGQYQHDVDQNLLKSELDAVVMSCVNAVGVNVNTASKWLLQYISGLGPQLAGNVVEYREKNGPFTSREALKNVPRMGPKAYEQCAGFLRIPNASNILDNSAVHPEKYHIVQKWAKDLKVNVEDLLAREEWRNKIELEKYIDTQTGMETLQDIMKELAKPGADPRATIRIMEFDKNIRHIEDLQVGMILPGIVSNITNFGAFVDIGVKQDGLVHLSQMANRFIKDPNEVVQLQQQVKVKVLEVDIARKRINLSMKIDK